MPSRVNEARSVVFLPQLRGTLPLARCPLGVLAYRGGQSDVGPALIQHTYLPGIRFLHLLSPSGTLLLVAYGGTQYLFCDQPSRLMTRLIVQRTTKRDMRLIY